jgi:SagB-type dehydrogenase family enzyme
MRIKGLGICVCGFLLFGSFTYQQEKFQAGKGVDKIKGKEFILPKPAKKGKLSLEEAILKRRSRRNFAPTPIKIGDLSQLLWAAQGITDKARGFRAAPSAGALYPMEIFAVLPKGVYRYNPKKHLLELVKKGDQRKSLSEASLDQSWVEDASVNIVITAIYERCSIKYGKRARRYCMIEAGCIAENIYLQAESLGLGTVIIGAFKDVEVQEVLGLKRNRRPIIIMPVGIPR